MDKLSFVLAGTLDWLGDDNVWALKILIAIAAAYAGYYLTGFVQDKWSKRKQL